MTRGYDLVNLGSENVSGEILSRGLRGGICGIRVASHFCSSFLTFPFTHSLCRVCFSTRVYKIRIGLFFSFLAETILRLFPCSALPSPFLKLLTCSLNTRLKSPGEGPSQPLVLWGWATSWLLLWAPNFSSSPSVLCESSRTFRKLLRDTHSEVLM